VEKYLRWCERRKSAGREKAEKAKAAATNRSSSKVKSKYKVKSNYKSSSCCCSRSRKSSKIKSSKGNVKTDAEARQERAPFFCERGSAPLALSPSPQGQNRKPGSKRKREIAGELQAGKTLKQV